MAFAVTDRRQLDLEGLWLRLQGYPYCPLWVKTRVESSTLVFLETSWKIVARQFNLRRGDSLCCRFDGEENLSIRAFDADDNRLEPCWESSRDDDSGDAGGASISSSAGESTGQGGTNSNSSDRSPGGGGGGDSDSSSDEGAEDVKPPLKQARRYDKAIKCVLR